MNLFKEHFVKEYRGRGKYYISKKKSDSFNKTIREAFIARFLIRPDKVADRVVTVGDLTFVVTLREDKEILYVQLTGNCPKNGEKTLSKKCYHDWEIGEMIIAFSPKDGHVCKMR